MASALTEVSLSGGHTVKVAMSPAEFNQWFGQAVANNAIAGKVPLVVGEAYIVVPHIVSWAPAAASILEA